MRSILLFILISIVILHHIEGQGKAASSQEGIRQDQDFLLDKCRALLERKSYDSLRQCADQLLSLGSNEDRVKAIGLYFKSQSFSKSDSSSYMGFLRESLTLSEKINYTEGIGLNGLRAGIWYRANNEYRKAIYYLEMGIAACQQPDKDYYYSSNELLADLYHALSSVYHNQGNYMLALKYGIESNRIAVDLGDKKREMKSHYNLSAVYGELASDDNNLGTKADQDRYNSLAKKYMINAYKTSLAIADDRSIGAAAYNLGLFYNTEKIYDSSNYYLNKAVAVGEKIGYHELLSYSYNVIASNHLEKGDDRTALLNYDKSLKEAKIAQFSSLQASALIGMADIFHQRSEWDKATKKIREAIKISEEIESWSRISKGYKLLSEIETSMGNTGQALESYKIHIQYKDSIVNEKNYSTIEELKTKYATELKDKEIADLTYVSAIQELELGQKNMALAAVLVISLLAGFLVFFYFRQASLKNKQLRLQAEQKLLRTQLNPHFIYNALSAIQHYVCTQNDPYKASDYLAQFSNLTRQILDHSREDFITIEQEVAFLNNYLKMQQLRFEQPFLFQIEIDEELEDSEVLIPPMFTQPFIENSIEHGILHRQSGGRITISFKMEGEGLVILLEDNGIGREKASFLKRSQQHQSLATTITKERIALLRNELKKKVSFAINDLGDEKHITGTQVKFQLPIIYA